MGSIAEQYCSGVKRDTSLYYPAWLPNAPIRLGDVGVLDGNVFIPETSLAEQGIEGIGVVDDPSSTTLDLQSHQDVKVSLKLAGEVNGAAPTIPQARAGVVVEFGRSGAYVLKAPESYEPRLANVARLEDEIRSRFAAGAWRREWVVVSRVVRTPRATILVSRSSNARLELTAGASVEVGDAVKLGDASAAFQITSESGQIFNFLDASDVTPLFQLVGLRRRLFGTRVGPLSAAGESDATFGRSEGEDSRDSLYLALL